MAHKLAVLPPRIYNVINSTTSHPNGVAATSTFLQTKVASRCSKQRLKSFNYAMFKDIGYNRTGGNTPEIVAGTVSALLLHWLDLGIGTI